MPDLKLRENCALLGFYAASSGNFLPTFWENINATFRGQESKDSRTLKVRPIGCPETSLRNYHCSLRNNPEERSYHLILRYVRNWELFNLLKVEVIPSAICWHY
jgi:hypothetical protein